MTPSAARIAANQANALKSTGPRTEEGKARSRANALKHGLTGAGIVLPNEDAAEVDRRLEVLDAELRPDSEVGRALVRRVAVLSVRLDRCVSQETASLSERVRKAGEDFEGPEGADPATVDRLRAEAMARALFDPSREATLARSYEAAAERGFYRALKELRQVEKEPRPEPSPAPPSDAEAIRKAMALFDDLDRRSELLEAKYLDLDKLPPVPPSRSAQSPNRPMAGRRPDVPITIGRRG